MAQDAIDAFQGILPGKMEVLDKAKLWTPEHVGDQEGFLESMAAAAVSC